MSQSLSRRPLKIPTAATVDLLTAVFDEIDYSVLEEVYCDEGGEAFWADRRQPVLELGLLWSAALGHRLPREGRSLYVGAGVAELPAAVTEVVDLGRELRISNLRQAECDCLNRALAVVGLSDRIVFTAGAAETQLADDRFDHLSLVSVLSDPETYPNVSGVTYGRIPPAQLDVAGFERERKAVQQLVASLLAAMQTPYLVTTTAEEVPWIVDAAQARGLSVEADDKTVETALVGDPIGFLWVREGAVT